jgi:hypothetical protein
MTPDTTPGQGKHTQATIDYYEKVVYPDWPWKPQKAVRLGNAVPENKRNTIKPQKKEIPTTIYLLCGCTATVSPDGKTTYPHHIKGCNGKEMD